MQFKFLLKIFCLNNMKSSSRKSQKSEYELPRDFFYLFQILFTENNNSVHTQKN